MPRGTTDEALVSCAAILDHIKYLIATPPADREAFDEAGDG
jgi:hypothetical protein